MRKVRREELVDYKTYEDRRPEERPKIMAIKAPRRILLGEYLTLLFENADTIRYQVQEMMRAERIVREAEIRHELDTYNGLLGDEGELGFTLLIGVADEKLRDEKLRAWLGLESKIYARTAAGDKVYATFDAAQVGEDRISSVQYMKFPLEGADPVAIGCDFEDPDLRGEFELSDEQRAALASDLRS